MCVDIFLHPYYKLFDLNNWLGLILECVIPWYFMMQTN